MPTWVDVASAFRPGGGLPSLPHEIESGLTDLAPRASDIPCYSTVTGGQLDTCGLDATYWYRNLREPVALDAAIRALLDAGLAVTRPAARPAGLTAQEESVARLAAQGLTNEQIAVRLRLSDPHRQRAPLQGLPQARCCARPPRRARIATPVGQSPASRTTRRCARPPCQARIATRPRGVFTVTGQGHLLLPTAVRHWCGLTAGERTLLPSQQAGPAAP